MREIYEETSLCFHLTPFNKSKRLHKCLYFYIILDHGSNLNLNPIDTKEINEIRWVNRQQLGNLSSQCNKQLRLFLNKWDFMMSYMSHNAEALRASTPTSLRSTELVELLPIKTMAYHVATNLENLLNQFLLEGFTAG